MLIMLSTHQQVPTGTGHKLLDQYKNASFCLVLALSAKDLQHQLCITCSSCLRSCPLPARGALQQLTKPHSGSQAPYTRVRAAVPCFHVYAYSSPSSTLLCMCQCQAMQLRSKPWRHAPVAAARSLLHS